MKKTMTILLFGFMSMLLGIIAGIIIWIILHIINFGIEFIWDIIPNKLLNLSSIMLIYYLFIGLVGGILIGLYQKKNGVMPDIPEEVMDTIKKEGKYPYNNLKKYLLLQ